MGKILKISKHIYNPQISIENKRLGYLSAALRVSTNLNAMASGPRSHVIGVIQAFTDIGWQVIPYIVGNQMPKSLLNRSETQFQRSFLIRLIADIVRLMMGIYHSIRAWYKLHKKVDWVYERFAVLQALGWIFQNGKVKWILETNGLFYYEAAVERKSILLSGLARCIEVWAYHQCDVLICITEALKDLIVKETGVSPEKILVVPNGVDVIRFDPDKYKAKRFFNGPTLGFVGTLIHWHRLDILIDALVELKTEGVFYNLVVVGDGPMRNPWERYARDIELGKNILFIGQIGWDEIPDYIAGFDIGYLGNNPLEIGVMYHSPLKLYEYMAMAKPVVAPTCIDAIEMISPHQSGYLFDQTDKEDLKRTLRQAWNDRNLWKQMGMKARERVIEFANWKVRILTMIIGINQILSK